MLLTAEFMASSRSVARPPVLARRTQRSKSILNTFKTRARWRPVHSRCRWRWRRIGRRRRRRRRISPWAGIRAAVTSGSIPGSATSTATARAIAIPSSTNWCAITARRARWWSICSTAHWAPGDVYYACAHCLVIGRPCRYVVDALRSRSWPGLGRVAQRLGIKPGSPEFHRLKRASCRLTTAGHDRSIWTTTCARTYPDRGNGQAAVRPGAAASRRSSAKAASGRRRPGRRPAGIGQASSSLADPSEKGQGKGQGDGKKEGKGNGKG